MAACDYSSSHPNMTYNWALEQAFKGHTVYVAEVIYPHPFSPIYYFAYIDTKPEAEPGMSSFVVEMTIKPLDEWGLLTDRDVRTIHKVMRRIDDSKAWPICGKFNATDRAINRLRYDRLEGAFDCPYSYWKSLEEEISKIVNSEV